MVPGETFPSPQLTEDVKMLIVAVVSESRNEPTATGALGSTPAVRLTEAGIGVNVRSSRRSSCWTQAASVRLEPALCDLLVSRTRFTDRQKKSMAGMAPSAQCEAPTMSSRVRG